MTDARPRASPYRGGLFEATCSFPYNSSYPFCVPTVGPPSRWHTARRREYRHASASHPLHSARPPPVPVLRRQIKFTGPVFHPHVYADGGVDPELTSVLWRSVAVPLASKVPPVLLAHLLLELLA